MRIATETATLVIYDLAQLQHRVNDECDWWVDEVEELKEINKGNVLFVGLEEDGFYEVELSSGVPEKLEEPAKSLKIVTARLKNSSGQFFIGPGEAVTGAGDEPEEGKFFHFYKVPPGDYEVVVIANEHRLLIWFNPIDQFKANQFEKSPSLFDEEYGFERSLLEPDEGIDLVLDRVCDHLEQSGYQPDLENDEELIYLHEDYGYLLVEIFERGLRFATTVAYDIDDEQKLTSYEEWHAKLLEVLDRFNANASVARAYNNIESQEVVFDAWYPPIYAEEQFDLFLDLWHEDVLNKLEEAQNDVFVPHQTH